jgi:alcohol dehydrogenase
MAAEETNPESLVAFDYHSRVRIVFGEGSVARAHEIARELGARKILLVTDPGIAAAGHLDRVRDLLEHAGMTVACFDQVVENPGTNCVERCAQAARDAGADTFVGLGGGSSMDTAKGANFLVTNGGRMRDYWGVGKATQPMLPLIAIPTTAGTGSECQSFALIADEDTHQKMACGDPKAAARVAILDPCLTVSQPSRVTAFAGIDTLAHAVETAVTRKRHALSLLFSYEAGRLSFSSFQQVLREPGNLAARGRMLLGAALAGTAIENSMLGAAHAAANPLTAHHRVVHGQAVGLMLPAVIRYNSQLPEAKQAYVNFALAAKIAHNDGNPTLAVEALIARLEWLLDEAGLPKSLACLGIDPSEIPRLAQEAARQWTAGFNPRPLTVTDFEALYADAFCDRRLR